MFSFFFIFIILYFLFAELGASGSNPDVSDRSRYVTVRSHRLTHPNDVDPNEIRQQLNNLMISKVKPNQILGLLCPNAHPKLGLPTRTIRGRRFGNKDIGLWISPPPNSKLLHVSILPVSQNFSPDSLIRTERKIRVRFLTDRGLWFVVYEEPNGNILGADIKVRY